ncbi:MAG: beta-propeller fold lactonase family protein [Planctomycetota bacterium]|nr:beta-propeller fold lactonase family protein [Planctomycetota bacterium]
MLLKMKNHRLALFLLGSATLLSIPSCGGGGSGGSGSGSSGTMDVQQISNGFGQLVPFTVFRLNASGQPTGNLVSIRTTDDLVGNVTATNPIRAVPQFPTDATLPNNQVGNHFFFAEFTQDIDINSVLDASATAQTAGGLTGAITLVALDPATGLTSIVPARVFIGVRVANTTGQLETFAATYSGTPTGSPPVLPFQRWVKLDPTTGGFVVQDIDGLTPGLGFPGTQSQFTGFQKLISTKTIVFVADTDNDLSTHDVFPAGRQLRLRVTTSVRSTGGKLQKRSALASTTVGQDLLVPEISTTPPPINSPVISPGSGDTNVDPMTTIRVEFTENVQPLSIGSLPNGQAPVLSSSLNVEFGPSSQRVKVPFTVLPTSVLDLSIWDLTPIFNFPGEGPTQFQCGVFNRVDVSVVSNQVQDLATVPNRNLLGATTFFKTGEGPGVVNAPVTPDVIYVSRSGAVPGLSVIDLNGFGQSTGIPTFDPTYQTFGSDPYERTNFPNNPNVKLQGSTLRPALTPGTCTVNGGSSGVYTLTRDSSLNNLLVRAPLLSAVGDMMLGHALDGAFNNGPSPFGCQSGGGTLCASDGKKSLRPAPIGQNTMGPVQANQTANILDGGENLAGWAPHPNPPPLVFPPLCASPFIGGQEPTSIDTPATTLLTPGDPQGSPTLGLPPTGLLTKEQNAFFQGPSIEQQTITACANYMIRQQIGQFLYVIDRARREIVILNSNRMTVIDRILTFDPTALAISPNLSFLAVVNQLSNLVTFIDIEPTSATFHQVVTETVVGQRPRGIAWDGGNEDVLVANEGEDSVSVIGAASLQVRKVVRSQLDQPFEIAITPRQQCFGFNRNVYFAYVLNRNGRIAIFESGPNSVNGWGYDDVIGITSQTFRSPKAMQIDQVDLRSALWIAHEGPINPLTGNAGNLGIGAMTKLVTQSGINGQLPLNFTSLAIPQFRDMSYGVQVSISTTQLSGVPVDVAFDNQRMFSGQPNFVTPNNVGLVVSSNGKSPIRSQTGSCTSAPYNTSEPTYMFVAVPNSLNGTGVVDVILLDGAFSRVDVDKFHSGIQSITCPNVQGLSDYMRQ